MDAMFALRQSSGSLPCSYDCVKMKQRTGAICSAANLRTLLGILSGPEAFETSSFFLTVSPPPCTENSMSGLVGKEVCCMVGILSSSLVKRSGIDSSEHLLSPGHLSQFGC